MLVHEQALKEGVTYFSMSWIKYFTANLAQWPSGKTAKNGLDSKLDHSLQIRPPEVNQQSKMPDFLHTKLYLNMLSKNIRFSVELSPSFAKQCL